MAITNVNKKVLNERKVDTGYVANYHVVTNIAQYDEGTSFTVKSYRNEAGYTNKEGEAITEGFFCPSTVSGYPFTEAVQKAVNVTLKTLIEEELLKDPVVEPEGKREWAFRGYLKGGTRI